MFFFSFKEQTGDPKLQCKMYPGPEKVRKSGYTDEEVKSFGIQKGAVPKRRMGHTMFALNQYIVLIGGHTKEWKGQSLTFRNLEDNLYILNTNTMEWKKCSIVNDGGNCLQRSLFMYSISGKCILVSI